MVVFPSDLDIPIEHTETNFSKLKASLREFEDQEFKEKIADSKEVNLRELEEKAEKAETVAGQEAARNLLLQIEQEAKKYKMDFLKNQFYARLARAIYHLRKYQVLVEKESKTLQDLTHILTETIFNPRSPSQNLDKEEELLNISPAKGLIGVRTKAAQLTGLEQRQEAFCQQFNLLSKNKARALGQFFNCEKLIKELDNDFLCKRVDDNLDFNNKLLSILQEEQLISSDLTLVKAEGEPFTFLELIEYFQLKDRLIDSPALLSLLNSDSSSPLTIRKVKFNNSFQPNEKQSISTVSIIPRKSSLKKSVHSNYIRRGYKVGVEFEWNDLPWAAKTLKKVPEIVLWQRRHTIMADVQTLAGQVASCFSKIKLLLEELKMKFNSLPNIYQTAFNNKIKNLESAINAEYSKYITIEKNALELNNFSSFLQQANEGPEQPYNQDSKFTFEALYKISAYEQTLKECDTNYLFRRIKQISKEIEESSQQSASLQSASNLKQAREKKMGKKSTFFGLGLSSSRSSSKSSAKATHNVASETLTVEETKSHPLLQRFTQLKIGSTKAVDKKAEKSKKGEKNKGAHPQ